VPRPSNAYPDEVVWDMLGISRRTFFRKLSAGEITPPLERAGTKRRWWTETDVEIARQELAGTQELERMEAQKIR
jgi:predicted DNA-binding transcriptional regulator AlpA